MKKDGEHIAAVRSWMQCKCPQGSYVTWGSFDDLGRQITPYDMEEAAQWVAEATTRETQEKMRDTIKSLEKSLSAIEEKQFDTAWWSIGLVVKQLREFLDEKQQDT